MPPAKPLNNWISCPQPRPGARLRLFCFPYAGGGASVYRAWWSALPPQVEVCSIQPPGREHRLAEPPISDFTEFVESLYAVLVTRLDRPFAFFGHSLGSLVAFECARLLRERVGSVPFRLYASGCRAPQVPSRERRVHQLPDEEFRQELRTLNGTPEEALNHPELMALLLPIVRADFGVYESYSYCEGAPLACPIDAFGGNSDTRIREEDLSAWREQTTGPFGQRMFPGDHFFLHAAQGEIMRAVGVDLHRYAVGMDSEPPRIFRTDNGL